MKLWPILALSLTTATLLTACSNGSSGAANPATTSSPNSPTTNNPSTTQPSATQPSSTQPSKPVATESNPPGDIPDNQAFVTFTASGFAVKVPEGWARSNTPTTTSFTDKLNRIEVSSTPATTAPTPQSVTSKLVPDLRRTVPRFTMGKVSQVTRPAGQVVLITYQGDSAQDPVTGKVVRDAFERYVFYRAGKQLSLTLAGPVNADNVDPWKIVSDSVRWL
ncbi:lipoprotein [Kribbella hippodromi]|uniref:Lipoprotein n=1 Tax=Kribbella hippodromi TaxID=434347 RepID=A0ABP4NFB5_9ACTN